MFSKFRYFQSKSSSVPKNALNKNALNKSYTKTAFSKVSTGAMVRAAPRFQMSTFVAASHYNHRNTFSVGSSVAKSSSFKWLLAASAATVGYLVWSDSENREAMAADKVPIYGIPGTNKERSFIAIKPDGVHRSYVGEVISRFEAKGYKLVAIKVVVPTKEFAEKHYADLSKKPFFPSLVNYFSSGPVVAMVWEGKDVISGGRTVIGATNPQQATPGTIRGDYAITIGRNMIHGSDSAESAHNEISLWFNEKEVADFDHALDKWVHEK